MNSLAAQQSKTLPNNKGLRIMVRKLAVAVAAAGLMTSGLANALGLGEITLNSALNQPLDAEIELIQVRELGSSEILPNLATNEDFNRAGVERIFFLSNIKFQTVVQKNGRSYIKVTSRKPVSEPYLNFLVEVHWPSGRLLREYTVLLDPPTFSQQPVTTVQAPASSAPTQQPRAEQPVRSSSTPSSQPATTGGLDGDNYTIRANDTLWEIAAQVKPSRDVTVHQTMVAIQALNPDAFINDNINLLKRGKVLRVPSSEQIKQVSHNEAVSLVAEQTRAWKTGDLQAPQLDATRRASAAPEAEAGDGEGRLKIVSAPATPSASQEEGGGDTGQTGPSAQQVETLQNELSVTQENLDKARRENEEITSRLTELEDQIGTLQRLLSLKDEQLAALQAKLSEQESATTQPAVSEPEPVSEPAVTTEPEPQPETEPVPTETVETPQPKPEVSLIDRILQEPMYLVGAGGTVVLVVLGLLFLSRRNARKEEELYQESLDAEADTMLIDEEEELEQKKISEVALEKDEKPSAPVKPETSDPLGEADIYIAYGRFSHAEDLLRNAINDEPSRTDLRVKLLEVYAEMQNADAFKREFSELEELADQGAINKANALKGKFPSDAFGVADTGIDYFTDDQDLASLEAELAGDTLTMDDLDEELSLDDLGLEEPTSVEEPEEESVLASSDLDEELDLSLDDLEKEVDELSGELSLDALDEAAEASQEIHPQEREAGYAEIEGLDFDLDKELAEVDAESEGLDFDLEGLEPASAESLDDVLSLDLETTDLETGEVESSLDEFALDEELKLEPEQSLAETEDVEMDFSLDDLEIEDTDIATFDEAFDLSVSDEAAEAAVTEPELTSEEKDFMLGAELDDDLASLDAATESLAAELSGAVGEEESVTQKMVEPEPQVKPAPVAEAKPEPTAAKPEPVPEAPKAAPVAESADDMALLAGADETATKLDLARAYIDMGDHEGARDILDEVMQEGNDSQKQEAQTLINSMG
ncbi:FimV/HubP family polar landmark protein [Zooshikella sp. RANM57]